MTPSHVNARVLLGRTYLTVGNPLAARKELRKAVSLDPENLEALVFMVVAERVNGDPERKRSS